MNEQECLSRMVAPGTPRQGKYRKGVIQIWVTRSCDKSCFGCTQGSNLAGKPEMITPSQFEEAVASLSSYWGVIGMFGGNPATHPQFAGLCEILRKYIPREQCGLWCNNPLGKGGIMRQTFNHAVSNLNCHLDRAAYDEFKRTWPESQPFGVDRDSRHSPPFVAMRDVLRKPCPDCGGTGGRYSCGCDEPDCCEFTPCETCHNEGQVQLTPGQPPRSTVYDESAGWDLISRCPINQHWSAMIGVFRGKVRAWFCEIAGAQAMLHQDEPDYPDTGLRVDRLYDDGAKQWWQLPMHSFADQVRQHCHSCGVPLQGYGELAQAKDGKEQVSATHQAIYKPKRPGRTVELVMVREQLGKPLALMTDYLGNAAR